MHRIAATSQPNRHHNFTETSDRSGKPEIELQLLHRHLGGKLEVWSEPRVGTEIELRFQLQLRTKRFFHTIVRGNSGDEKRSLTGIPSKLVRIPGLRSFILATFS